MSDLDDDRDQPVPEAEPLEPSDGAPAEEAAPATDEPLAPEPAEETAPPAAEREPVPEPEPEPSEEADAAKPALELPPEMLALCKAAIEALLFSLPEPVSSRKLSNALRDTGIDGRGVRKIVRGLIKEYDESRRGFTIEQVAGGFQMMTRPDYAEYVAELSSGSSMGKLSQAALETLAVVAYKQPVTRADIEVIRGVQAGPLLRTLLHKGLVRITGRAEVIGRPLLYGTTRKFMEHFGLKSLNELPKVEELPRP